MAACERGAINHEMADEWLDLTVGTIILATGFKDFDPVQSPRIGLWQAGQCDHRHGIRAPDQRQRPHNRKVLLKNGQPPKSVAIVHCVGSRDSRYHEYCSRACCMYSLKLAQLVHDYVGAEVHEIYRDMRSFGKGYEEFYNRTAKTGVHFYHGRVRDINQQDGKLSSLG